MRRKIAPYVFGLGSQANGLPSDDEVIARGVDAGERWVMSKLGVGGAVQDAVTLISNVGADALEGYGVAYTALNAAAAAGVIASDGAIAAAIPTVGWVVGAILGVVAVLEALSSCSINVNDTPVGPVSFDCTYYAQTVVPGALQWVQENPQAAVSLTPQEFAHQASIAVFDWPPPQIASSYSPFGTDSAGNPVVVPGAASILRATQLSAASALAAAYPALWPLFRVTFETTFPLLSSSDLDAIGQRVEPLHQAILTAAQAWAETQIPAPSADAVHAKFPWLIYADAQTVAAGWAPPPAPPPPPPTGGGGGIVRVPGPIHMGGNDGGGSSTASKVAGTTAVVAGASAVALWFYSVHKGITFAMAAHGWYKRGKSAIERMRR